MTFALITLASTHLQLKCLRIVYLNGDVDIRHNVIGFDAHRTSLTISSLQLRRRYLGRNTIVRVTSVGGCISPIHYIHCTPQDSYRHAA